MYVGEKPQLLYEFQGDCEHGGPVPLELVPGWIFRGTNDPADDPEIEIEGAAVAGRPSVRFLV